MTKLVATLFLLLVSNFLFAQQKLSGKISIDGSSTVYPITEAVAEEFRATYPDVKVNIGVSGTGGGFKKFVVGQIDISNASRPIKDKEVSDAKKNKINYLELAVAYDGLTVVVNKKNNWVDYLTTEELKKIWDKDSRVKMWSDIRPTWPARAIKLYGPGTDSGTFDYFTEAINGKAQQSRGDYTKSEDDNVLVTGVAGDQDSLGYFGYAYFKENSGKIKAVAIHNGEKSVLPEDKTITNGSYRPLSRKIYIYVNSDSLKRPELNTFIDFYLKSGQNLVHEVGYTALSKDDYSKELKKFENYAKK